MKIGIYGGSFNPPHNGHIMVAKYVVKYLKLDKLIIVPVGIPSHRRQDERDPVKCYEMCKIAFSNIKNVCISNIEVVQSTPSYTFDTLMSLKKKYGKNHEYFEIIGADSLAYFDKWKNYNGILENATIVSLKRRGSVGNLQHEKIIEVDSPYFDYSSTEVRNLVKNNLDIKKFVSYNVEKYIKVNKLYEN